MKSQEGFSLIELAFVLIIVSMLVVGLAVPLSAQIEARRIGETRKTMEEAREALIGYAMSNLIGQTCDCRYKADKTLDPPPTSSCPVALCPSSSDFPAIELPFTRHHLPCPDLNGADPEPAIDNDGVGGLTDAGNGVEDRLGATPAVCAGLTGNLPWVTLATAAQDAWGNRLRYAVTPVYANSATGFSNADLGDKQICNTSVGGCAVGTIASSVPVVLISYGPNGWGARNVNNTNQAAPTSNDELENTNLNDAYVSRPPSQVGAVGGEFDDLVVWLSSPLLFSRTCSAHGCP